MTREKIILPLIRNKDVLDIGSVGEKSEYIFWNLLKRYAKQLTGIDTRLSNDPAIVQGNMETYNFQKKFDIIVGGDVLIQTDNQGLFLDNIRKHLKNDGRLILTMSNARWPSIFFRPSLFQTGLHNKYTLKQILKNHRFKIASLDYYYGNLHTLLPIRKTLFYRQALIVVCKKT